MPREGAHNGFPSIHGVWKDERSVGTEKKEDCGHLESQTQALAGQPPSQPGPKLWLP